MSDRVTHRLEELARMGERRRRTTRQIRRESSLAIERVRQLQEAQSVRWGSLEGLEARHETQEAVLGQVQTLSSGDVLDQVRGLLGEIDAQQREQWTDDDALIFLYLREAWAAAMRKGYDLHDLMTILRSLAPRDSSDAW